MAEIPTKPIEGDAILPWAERMTDAVKWARKPDGWRPRSESYRSRFPFQVEMGLNTDGTPAQSTLWVRGGYWLHITDVEEGTHVLAALQAGNIDNTESVDVSAESAGTLQLWIKLDFTAAPAITIETEKVEAENVYWKLLAECTLAGSSGTSVIASKIQQRWRGGDIGPTISGVPSNVLKWESGASWVDEKPEAGAGEEWYLAEIVFDEGLNEWHFRNKLRCVKTGLEEASP